MEGLPNILGFFRTFNSIISFSRNAREVVLFSEGLNDYSWDSSNRCSEIKIFPSFKTLTLCVNCWVFYFSYLTLALSTQRRHNLGVKGGAKHQLLHRWRMYYCHPGFPRLWGLVKTLRFVEPDIRHMWKREKKKLAQSFVPLFVWGESTDMSKKMLETTWCTFIQHDEKRR